ncbi:MAG: hypothetical protein DCF20_01865 [Pseudanabaena sp.]|nr:MAG: hypothetical protein DCF20_01865 [Pseudanabaena sp.]
MLGIKQELLKNYFLWLKPLRAPPSIPLKKGDEENFSPFLRETLAQFLISLFKGDWGDVAQFLIALFIFNGVLNSYAKY